MLSDPDFINQNIAYWIADSSVDFHAIVDLIRWAWLVHRLPHRNTHVHNRATQTVSDIKTIFGNLEDEITTKIASSTSSNKQHFESLLFAKRECENRHRTLTGEYLSAQSSDATEVRDLDLPLSFFLETSAALEYLTEFLEAEHVQHYADFYLNVDAFRQGSLLRIQDSPVTYIPQWDHVCDAADTSQHDHQSAVRSSISQEASELCNQVCVLTYAAMLY